MFYQYGGEKEWCTASLTWKNKPIIGKKLIKKFEKGAKVQMVNLHIFLWQQHKIIRTEKEKNSKRMEGGSKSKTGGSIDFR